MKRFFYFSVSILCLALAALIGFHIGSQSVEAQDSGLSIAGYHVINHEGNTDQEHFVCLSNGDIYHLRDSSWGDGRIGNIFGSNPPVNASESTWGNVKNQFKK